MDDPYSEVEKRLNEELNGTQLVTVHWVAYVDVLDAVSGERSLRRVVGDGTPDWIAERLYEIYEESQAVEVEVEDED